VAFGVVQDTAQAGFCATIEAKNSDFLAGAHVLVSSSKHKYAPHFFNKHSLPQKQNGELESNGRFCVYNIQEEIVDVLVSLANGQRRGFTVHLKPTIFEPNLVFNLENAVWRSVAQMELVDFDEVMEAAKRDTSFVFGAPGLRTWYDGKKSASWTKVSHAAIAADKAYSAVVSDKNAAEPLYFPLGEELTEVRWGTSPSSLSAFALVSRESAREGAVKSKTGASSVIAEPLSLKMLDRDAVDEMERVSGKSLSHEKGMAFVDVDLAAIGTEYSEVRFSVRDVWNAKKTGELIFVPMKGNSNSRFVRFFVGGLSEGQHALVISDKSGALKWLDVVRARPGMLHVLSVGD
jgi:hypothetical protein